MINLEFIIPLKEQFITVSDTKEHCFAATLKYLQKEGYTIWGLKKTACGNSHDENWRNHLTVIKDGGLFADFLKTATLPVQKPYEDIPYVNHIDELTVEEIEKWSNPYHSECNIEERNRYIYATKEDKLYVLVTASTYADSFDESYNKNDLYKCVHLLNVKIRPWEENN